VRDPTEVHRNTTLTQGRKDDIVISSYNDSVLSLNNPDDCDGKEYMDDFVYKGDHEMTESHTGFEYQ